MLQAPEVLARQHYSQKADSYSFGIVMWEACARQVRRGGGAQPSRGRPPLLRGCCRLLKCPACFIGLSGRWGDKMHTRRTEGLSKHSLHCWNGIQALNGSKNRFGSELDSSMHGAWVSDHREHMP